MAFKDNLQDFGFAAGGNLLSTGLGLLTQNASNRNNYNWGEKAAQQDFNRQMEMYERQYQDRSPLNVVNQLKEAGLSKSLMFSGGAGGVGGQAQGSTAPQNKMGFGNAMNGANLAMTMAQMQNIKADAKLKEEQAETEKTTRDAKLGDIEQSGYQKYISNFQETYKMLTKTEGGEDWSKIQYGADRYGDIKINGNSLFNDSLVSDIIKTQMEAGKAGMEKLLTEEKYKNYFKEILNQTALAEAAKQNADTNAENAATNKIEAAAKKLSAEWQTGEFTNWKTWADLASKTFGDLMKIK